MIFISCYDELVYQAEIFFKELKFTVMDICIVHFTSDIHMVKLKDCQWI